MIHLTTCRACKRTTQDGSGASFDLSASERELADCDAVICDDDNGERATHTIPPVTRRKVMARDEGRCRVPGCRAARNLDVHHIVHRAHGGGHETSNLAVLCSGHHRLLHDGVITANGDANSELMFTRDGKVLVDSAGATRRRPTWRPQLALATSAATLAPAAAPSAPSAVTPSAATSARFPAASASSAARSTATTRCADVERRTLAKAALQQAGFKAVIAKQAVAAAEALVPSGADLETLLREALRHCC
jgi:hypothetical protein